MENREAIRILSMFTTDEAQRLTSSEFDDAIYMAIKALNNFDEWIPCSEDLPKQEGEYLVTCLDYKDKPFTCTLYYGYVNENDDEMCFHEWDDDMWDCWKPNVIAWMPKPEPYKPIK